MIPTNNNLQNICKTAASFGNIIGKALNRLDHIGVKDGAPTHSKNLKSICMRSAMYTMEKMDNITEKFADAVTKEEKELSPQTQYMMEKYPNFNNNPITRAVHNLPESGKRHVNPIPSFFEEPSKAKKKTAKEKLNRNLNKNPTTKRGRFEQFMMKLVYGSSDLRKQNTSPPSPQPPSYAEIFPDEGTSEKKDYPETINNQPVLKPPETHAPSPPRD